MDTFKVSDWVYTLHAMNKITGYVVGLGDGEISIQVTIPKDYGTIKMPVEKVWPDSETIWMDDIPTLIDFSLSIRDREWFERWRHELSLWKPANYISEAVKE